MRANPGVRLFDGDALTAYASVWVVDWSARGAGKAIVLWHQGSVRVLAGDPALGGWLERAFVRLDVAAQRVTDTLRFDVIDPIPTGWPASAGPARRTGAG